MAPYSSSWAVIYLTLGIPRDVQAQSYHGCVLSAKSHDKVYIFMPGDACVSSVNSFFTVRVRPAGRRRIRRSYFKRTRHTRLRNKLRVVARAFCGYRWSSSLAHFPLDYQAPSLSKAMAVLRRLSLLCHARSGLHVSAGLRTTAGWLHAYSCK